MEPRSRERGNVQCDQRPPVRGSKLQWSRAHVSAETARLPIGVAGTFLLQWSRAHVSAETAPGAVGGRRVSRASMEPRSRERGNWISTDQPLKPGGLQWSRAHVSAETLPTCYCFSSACLASMEP